MNVVSPLTSRWWKSRHHDPTVTEPDAHVVRWKNAWLAGATVAWTPGSTRVNPHPTGLERAAWDAGFKWAKENPDRRGNGVVRLAHPHRRASDSKLTSSLKGAAALGATGVALYAVSRALRHWRRPNPS